jgi:DNA-binding HxlR family transcriptional regulator
VLSAQLAALIAHQLVEREQDEEVGVYRLTAQGASLLTALMPAALWGDRRIRERGETPHPLAPP